MEGELPLITLGDEVGFTLAVRDLFSTPVDAIVNPANSGLSHGGGLAGQISLVAGQALDDECDAIIAEQGMLQTGTAVITTAGQMNFAAVVHAIGPRMGSGNEQLLLERTLTSCLQAAEHSTQQALSGEGGRLIRSIAFPAISTGSYGIPKQVCAQAFSNLMQDYIRSGGETEYGIRDIWLCVGKDEFETFATPLDLTLLRVSAEEKKEIVVGEISLDSDDIAALEDDSIDDWFVK